MIRDLYIENFRGFDKLKIDNIKKINFLVGQNNCGKTSVLETIMIILSESRFKIIENMMNISRSKENYRENKIELKNIFHNLDYNNNINLIYNRYDNINYNINISPISKYEKIVDDDNIELNYSIIITNENTNSIKEEKIIIHNIRNTLVHMSMKYVDNKTEVYIPSTIEYNRLTNYLIEILKNKKEEQLLEMISFFNKNIKAINILKNDIYINIDGINELVSLNLMGDGLKNIYL